MRGVRDAGVVRLAIARPVTMLMMFASVMVLGFVALGSIPLELIPSGATFPVMSISVPYSDATANDVEERITKPLEEALSTTPAIEEMSSVSTGRDSRITLVFESDADMDVAYREVSNRIDRVRGELPDDVRQINIRKHSGDDIPIAFYGVRWPEELKDSAKDTIERHLIRKMERVEGVGMVGTWGQSKREIRIEVDRALTEAANLNIFTVAQALQRAHFNLASGQVIESNGKFLLRSLANFRTTEELENAVVGPNDLRLGDVADVLYDFPEAERHDRWNGQPSMAVFVIKESQANTVEVCDRLQEAVDEAAKDPALARFGVQGWFIQGNTIRSSLEQVTDSGLQGGALAVLVLMFFLRRVRLTLIIAGAIPLSIFTSLPFMYFSGQSINLVSLIGLMICVGLVVDNSVVVAENIARYRARGIGRFAASLHGASEVALPITLATTTTMIVFLPSALMSSGQTQFFMLRLLTPVCVSLLGSLFVALVIIPLASSYVLDRDLFSSAQPGSLRARVGVWDARWKAAFERAYEATFGRARVFYSRLLAASLRRRMDVFIVSLLGMMSLAIPMNPETGVKFVPGQNEGGRQVRMTYTIPSDVPLDEADAFFRELEAWFEPRREKYNLQGEYVQVEPGFGQLSLFFEPPKKGDPPYREVGKEIYEMLPVPVGWTKKSDFGDSDGARSSAFPVFLFGADHEDVQRAKEALERSLQKVPGVVSVIGGQRDTSRRDELLLNLDDVSAERLGISAGVVANTIAYALRGSPLPRFNAEDREIDVWIRYRKEDREQLSDLMQFKVPGSTGGIVPISTVTTTKIARGEAALVRNNQRVAALIRLELDPEQREKAAAAVAKFLASYRLPDGVTFDADREARDASDELTQLVGGLALGTIFIFLLMGFLFESLVLPLSVLPAIPLAFVGVQWALYLTGQNIDVLAGIGVMLLVGVVVNNAIVLVDFINAAREQGATRETAIVQAGVQRFRPIFMTALTTVGGMLPLAFAEAPAEGIPYGPFAMTLVGGMITSTILTLIVVPVSYTLFDDLRTSVMRWVSRRFAS
jgi:HAE1 family hydrophobic/amphiphilic exporter-1